MWLSVLIACVIAAPGILYAVTIAPLHATKRSVADMSEIDDLRRLERTCVDEAEQCGTPDGRAAFLSLAGNYRAARLTVPMFAGQVQSAQHLIFQHTAHTTPSRIGRRANKVLLVLVSALGIEPRTP